MTDADLIEEYELLVASVVRRFVGLSITEVTMSAIKFEIVAAQREFLAHHTKFAATCSPEVFVDAEIGSLEIYAPIVTLAEKLKINRRSEQLEVELRDAEKRRRSMLRRHRRLMRLRSHMIPPSTRRIWDTLSDGQQYAILKDLDYTARKDRS